MPQSYAELLLAHLKIDEALRRATAVHSGSQAYIVNQTSELFIGRNGRPASLILNTLKVSMRSSRALWSRIEEHGLSSHRTK